MRAWALTLSIPLLASCATPGGRPSLTLAEARRMTVPALAAELMGRGPAGQGFVEAKVTGNVRGWISVPGLDAVDLYRAPRATAFPGICQIDGVIVRFEGGPRGSRDVPHRLQSRSTYTQFAFLDSPAASADCVQLTPLDGRDNPRLFWLGTATSEGSDDSPGRAYFGIRALKLAQAAAPALREAIRCLPDTSNPKRSECADPVATVTGFPIMRIDSMAIDQCAGDTGHLCVSVTHVVGPTSDGSETVKLTIATDAIAADAARPFTIQSISVTAESWIDD